MCDLGAGFDLISLLGIYQSVQLNLSNPIQSISHSYPWLSIFIDFDFKRVYMEEESEANTRLERKRNEALAPLRGAQLRDYVNGIRSALYNERLREKKEKYNETVLKYDISNTLFPLFLV